jgi:2-polyprenyl-3-methyl-5-hydroxy-6-metoxy-1,4-benzoquinol methylase
MKIHYDLSHVDAYIQNHSHIRLEDLEPQFEQIMKRVKKFKEINKETRILEVGTGTGWFPILCKKHGLCCEGIEICPQFVDHAFQYGERYGIKPDIRIGNIEESDIGVSRYDVVIATSTFEHVEHWEKGINHIFAALKPGGLFYFYSTNKFSLRSGEFNFPFYGWLPDKWRYRIRALRSGENIMKLGIDFNQFNHFQLKRVFRKIGFSKIFNEFEVRGTDELFQPSFWKKAVIKIIQRLEPIRLMALIFSPGTLFICIK